MNENRNNSGTAGGIGFCGLLTIAFIVLKLTGFHPTGAGCGAGPDLDPHGPSVLRRAAGRA